MSEPSPFAACDLAKFQVEGDEAIKLSPVKRGRSTASTSPGSANGSRASVSTPGSGNSSPGGDPAGLAKLRGEVQQLLCTVCKKIPRKKKMRFCADCARDVAACKKDSEQNGWKEVYEDQAKADDTFVFMILQYQERCSGKGRGFSRSKNSII